MRTARRATQSYRTSAVPRRGPDSEFDSPSDQMEAVRSELDDLHSRISHHLEQAKHGTKQDGPTKASVIFRALATSFGSYHHKDRQFNLG